uniref:syndecan-4 n=1 Tax=Euleptes europaea TaxID=460621 RepID=UPI002540A1BE|nr:syndecan-4 [Euleptes europaea]
MDPQLYPEEFASGDLPDDEDARPDFTIDEEGDDESSGSGDDADQEVVLSSVPAHPDDSVSNYIPDSNKDSKGNDEPSMVENEIIVPNQAVPPEGEDVSNKISMASTATGSIFERTEVLAALIAGGAVGLLFAVFLVLLLIYRMKKKDEGSYDLGKKPIYKKAPTNEFYA